MQVETKVLNAQPCLSSAANALIEFLESHKNQTLDLLRVEVLFKAGDCKDALRALSYPQKFYWSHRENGFELLGFGRAMAFSSKQFKLEDAFVQMQNTCQALGDSAYFFGGTRFDLSASISDMWTAFGEFLFVLPQIEVRKDALGLCLSVHLTKSADFTCLTELLRQFGAPTKSQEFAALCAPQSRKRSLSLDDWHDRVDQILSEIENQSLFKVVLARQDTALISKGVRVEDVCHRLFEKSVNTYRFLFQVDERHAFLGASPEQLFERKKRRIYTEAQAGTRPRGSNEEQDAALARELFNSSKDFHEHDMVHSDILRHLKSFCVDFGEIQKRQIVKLANVQHLRTQYGGILKDLVSDCDLLKTLHPTPAVCGAPQVGARALIRKLEPFDRGYYAGPIGIVGSEHTEFAVAIRSGLMHEDNLHVYAGAGIVAGSKAQDEWDEVSCKMRPLIHI